MSEDEVVRRRGFFLPHWTKAGAVYHVVFRLYDSLPAHVYQAWLEEERSTVRTGVRASSTHKRWEERVNRYLDECHGESYLGRPDLAQTVVGALTHFDGERYALHAWCVMPNHVHAIVQPLGEWELATVLHSWKSYTAHVINQRLGRTGTVWHKESYDRIIRDESEYRRTMEYVLGNPAKAGLEDWPWVGLGLGASQP